MKVLHVYKTYYPDPPGGIQQALHSICMLTQPLGFEHTIFTLSPTPTPSVIHYPEARVVRARSWASPASCDIGMLDAVSKFRDLSREVDVIHYLFPWPFADVLHHLVRPNTPAVMTYVSDVVRQKIWSHFYQPLRNSMLKQIQSIAISSPNYQKKSPILNQTNVREKLQIIPFGIPDFSMNYGGDSEDLKRFGIDVSQPYFLFIGALRYYKGLDYLLQAAKYVQAQIVIAGQDVQNEQLHSLANQLGVTNVIFTGAINEMQKTTLLHHCFAFVFPSHLRSEAFGMSLIEAAMFKKPMISCELGTGTSFINLDGKTGMVIPPANPNALAQAMNDLLAHPDRAKLLGAAARQRYETRFNGKKTAKLYARFFRGANPSCKK